jgi:hypothetical protein
MARGESFLPLFGIRISVESFFCGGGEYGREEELRISFFKNNYQDKQTRSRMLHRRICGSVRHARKSVRFFLCCVDATDGRTSNFVAVAEIDSRLSSLCSFFLPSWSQPLC